MAEPFSRSIHDQLADFEELIATFSTKHMQLSDEELECIVFEHFDVGAYSDFSLTALDRLKSGGYIDDEIIRVALKLRHLMLHVPDAEQEAARVRTSKYWRRMAMLCRAISSRKEKMSKSVTTEDFPE